MMLKRWMLLCVITTTLKTTVFAQNLSDVKTLMTDLFTDYNFRVRPVANVSDVLHVKVGFTLFSLNEVNDISEAMTTTGYLDITWTDADLVWDISSYSNVSYVLVPQKEVWRPDITLKNAVGEIEALGDETLNVVVSNTGVVKWYPFEKFQSTCSIDVRYYPFDEQVCTMEFAAWSFGTHQVTFESTGISLSFYPGSSMWTMVDTSARNTTETYEPTIFFSFRMKRKPMYVVLSVILPIILLAILDIFVFVLPVSTGEKIGYAVTVFLAFAVFLTLVEANMPKNAETVALISIYMLILTANSTCITLCALLMSKVLAMETLSVPKVFVWMSMIGRLDFSCCKKRKGKGSKVGNIQTLSVTQEDEKGFSMDDNTSCSSNSTSDDGDGPKATWESIMHGLEMFCIYFWSFVLILVSLVLLIGASLNTI